jgi:hypothetical protein
MIRILDKKASEYISAMVASMGALPLPVDDGGLLVMTPAQLALEKQAERKAVAQALMDASEGYEEAAYVRAFLRQEMAEAKTL